MKSRLERLRELPAAQLIMAYFFWAIVRWHLITWYDRFRWMYALRLYTHPLKTPLTNEQTLHVNLSKDDKHHSSKPCSNILFASSKTSHRLVVINLIVPTLFYGFELRDTQLFTDRIPQVHSLWIIFQCQGVSLWYHGMSQWDIATHIVGCRYRYTQCTVLKRCPLVVERYPVWSSRVLLNHDRYPSDFPCRLAISHYNRLVPS